MLDPSSADLLVLLRLLRSLISYDSSTVRARGAGVRRPYEENEQKNCHSERSPRSEDSLGSTKKGNSSRRSEQRVLFLGWALPRLLRRCLLRATLGSAVGLLRRDVLKLFVRALEIFHLSTLEIPNTRSHFVQHIFVVRH